MAISLHPVEVGAGADFDEAFARITREHVDALFVYHDFVTASHRRQIIDFAVRAKLPAMYAYREWADVGGLMSYGPNLKEMYGRAGRQVAQILSGGKPADLPVEQPTTFELVVNLKTAKALGTAMPPALLLRAHHVIE
jgi:putative ABC transport system substrate-binding protein